MVKANIKLIIRLCFILRCSADLTGRTVTHHVLFIIDSVYFVSQERRTVFLPHPILHTTKVNAIPALMIGVLCTTWNMEKLNAVYLEILGEVLL